jgi:hypothetical protein
MTEADASAFLVDGFAALGLAACAVAAFARRGRTPVDRPFVFLLATAAVFYGARSLFHVTASAALERISLALASLLPLAALILAETLLRRHAPKPLKLAVLAGAAFSLAVAVTGPLVRSRALDLVLLAYVGGGLVAVFALVAARKPTDLAPQEHTDLSGLSSALIVVLALLVTDFGVVSPVGLSGLGALGIAFVVAGGARAPAATVGELFAAGAASLLLAGGLYLLTGDPPLLLLAPTLAALLALAVALRLQATWSERRRGRFLRALASAPDASLATFLQVMSEQPLLKGMVVAEGAALAGYDDAALRSVFRRRPLRSAADCREGLAEGCEELLDLLERNACTHALLLTSEPLRIALVPAGAVRRPWDDESDLLAFQRMSRLVAEATA